MRHRERADFVFENNGSIWLVCPMNKAAREHLQAHVADDAMWWSGELVVEPRYVMTLASQLEDDGFSTEI